MSMDERVETLDHHGRESFESFLETWKMEEGASSSRSRPPTKARKKPTKPAITSAIQATGVAKWLTDFTTPGGSKKKKKKTL